MNLAFHEPNLIEKINWISQFILFHLLWWALENMSLRECFNFRPHCLFTLSKSIKTLFKTLDLFLNWMLELNLRAVFLSRPLHLIPWQLIVNVRFFRASESIAHGFIEDYLIRKLLDCYNFGSIVGCHLKLKLVAHFDTHHTCAISASLTLLFLIANGIYKMRVCGFFSLIVVQTCCFLFV